MRKRSSYLMLLVFSSLLFMAASCGSKQKEEEQPKSEVKSVEDYPEIKALTDKIAQDPNNAELYYTRGDAYTNLGYFKQAIQDLEKAIELEPEQDYYYVSLSDIYLLQEDARLHLPDSKKAIDILKDFLKDHPGNELVTNELGLSYLYIDKHDESIDLFRKAIQLKPFNPEAYFYIGVNYKYAGDTVKAIANFQKAVEQDPQYFDGYMQLGLLLSARKNDLALDFFNNAIQVDPRSVEAYYGKAKFLQDTKRFKEAKKVYRQLVTIEPQHEQTFYNLGYIYLAQDSLDKAYTNFDRAIQVDPGYADAYFGRGTVEEAQGKKEAAIADYRNALNIDPKNVHATQALKDLGITE